MNVNFDIQKIESALADFLRSTELTQPIFEGQRPSNGISASSFIVVSVPSSIIDLKAIGRCTSRIEIFVENDENGNKKGKVFSYIYDVISKNFPILHNKYIFDINPTLVSLGNDNKGYHVQALNINTLIKTV